MWALISIGVWISGYADVSPLLREIAFQQWDWQPGLWQLQPWRLWTAALVHWSSAHLMLNLLACVALGAWGNAVGLERRAALVWLAAWPVTHLLLAFCPALQHYGGLSGVLHAGVSIGVWHLLAQSAGSRRWVGATVGLGLVMKLVLEVPVLSQWMGLGVSLAFLPGAPDIQVAGEAHLAGALAGWGCAAVLEPMFRRCKR
ncbi:MAG: rhomboid family intramembrane serine protease [Rhodoferax sp.]|nr:rhomboid family intramembrane serine protease [Rhodoferax sp.]